MSPVVLLLIVFAYFAILLYVSYRTGKGSNNESFFIGNRNSNWMLVAFGMIGTSLSGVTFVSVPGAVGKDNFSYLQITLGYLIGYIIIAYVLLPLYYRLKLTSIYSYLQQRMGKLSEKTGATIFIISRLVGATARLYLVVNILQMTILDKLGVPFIATTIIILGMIILYTYEGGVKTIVWTDTLQTSCMLGGLIICTIYMLSHMGLSVGESFTAMHEKGYTQIFGTDPMEKNYCRRLYYDHYDGYRPGNDAEKPFCNQSERLSEKYGKPWFYYACGYWTFPLYGRIITSVWRQRKCCSRWRWFVSCYSFGAYVSCNFCYLYYCLNLRFISKCRWCYDSPNLLFLY